MGEETSVSNSLGAQAAGRVRGSVFLAIIGLSGALASYASAPGLVGIAGAGLALVMLTIAMIDWQHYVIPNSLNFAGLMLALLHAAALEPQAMLPAMAGAVVRAIVLALVFLAIRAGYAKWRGREGLGLGDVKLAGVAGAWLDWSMMGVAVEMAAAGALVTYLLARIFAGRPLHATNRIPFGAFFAPAIWLTWLLDTLFGA